MKLIGQVQYKAALVVSGCWQGTSRERLYEELGWESLSERRWSRRMTIFYKITNGMALSYLSDHIPQHPTPHVSLRSSSSRLPFSRTERYDNSFFPYCISNWNLLDSDIKSLSTLCEFKDKICKFFRPKGNSFYKIRDKYGIKLLTKIRVNFSDLRDHRYNHNFNCQNPSCACGLEDETTVHYFLCCPRYCQLRTIYIYIFSQTFALSLKHLHLVSFNNIALL